MRFDYIHFSIYIFGSTLGSPLRFDEPEQTSIFYGVRRISNLKLEVRRTL
jgi:hypothetical protein